MRCKTTLRGAAMLAIAALQPMLSQVAAADDAAGGSGGVVAPSTYVEGIETPGKTGGSADEADAARAQAGAAKTGTPEPTVSSGQHAAAIATDILIARPTAVMATVVGAAFYALSFPLTAATGTQDDARARLVAEPGSHLIAPLGGRTR